MFKKVERWIDYNFGEQTAFRLKYFFVSSYNAFIGFHKVSSESTVAKSLLSNDEVLDFANRHEYGQLFLRLRNRFQRNGELDPTNPLYTMLVREWLPYIENKLMRTVRFSPEKHFNWILWLSNEIQQYEERRQVEIMQEQEEREVEVQKVIKDIDYF